MIKTNLFHCEFIRAKRSSSRNLMIVLHGRGDSLKPFRGFSGELKLPEMNLLLLNGPRRYAGGYSWYSLEKNKSKHVRQVREDLFLLLEELEIQGWKSKNIFLFGFSQGCLVACDFAMNYSKTLGGVIGVSGYFHFPPNWRARLSQEAKMTPWLITHGRQDDVLSVDETREGVCRLRRAGISVRWLEMDKEHVIADGELPVMRHWVRYYIERPRSSLREAVIPLMS